MADTKRIRHLKIDHGRFFSQRRVPKDLQADLREKMWLRPRGDLTYVQGRPEGRAVGRRT
jgi:hypothetical protein